MNVAVIVTQHILTVNNNTQAMRLQKQQILLLKQAASNSMPV